MKITNMVSTGLILTLLGSNLILGESYILNQNKLEKKIHVQSQLITTKQKNNELLKRIIDVKSFENFELTKSYDKLKVQMDKIDKENTSLKKSNIKLKKILKERKEVNKSYFEVTAYTAGYESTQKSKGDIGYGITASGTKVKEGRTIACPPSMKFGTKINIERIGIRVCEDRGGAIQSGHLDLYFENVNKALDFGRQKLMVEILN